MFSKVKSFLFGISGAAAAIAVMGAATPSQAAETVSFWYGPIQRSIAVADLREYAQTKQPSDDLKAFFRLIRDEDRKQLDRVLEVKLPVNVVTVSKLVYSPNGDELLKKMAGAVIRRDNAAIYALRGALVLSAKSEDGVGLLSFLEAYPEKEMNLDVRQAMVLFKDGGGIESLLGGALGGALGK